MQVPDSLQVRKYLMLPIEFLSGWLFTIKKVRPELQAKLNLFRAEGFLALDAWFRQGLRSNPVVQEQFEIPQSLSEALEFAAQQVRENMTLKKQNSLMVPKVALFDAYMNTEGTLTLTEAGKILGMSAKVLGRELRRYGWLFKRKKGVIPTQHAMNRGWMIAVPIDGSIDGMPNCYGRITKRGLEILMETYMIEQE
ncbi:Phage antirepressor protein KilAC domain protein [anaerobic digester metagenome]